MILFHKKILKCLMNFHTFKNIFLIQRVLTTNLYLILIIFSLILNSGCSRNKPEILTDNAAIISAIDNEISYSFDQTFYVRPPGNPYGTGDGSSWTNAFADLPETLIRGAKYYLASGNYDLVPFSEHYEWHGFNDAEDGDKYIGVFKATANDHGTNDGWEEAFGEGTANLGPITLTTGNYIFDGQTGEKTSGHGFKLTTRDTDNFQAKIVCFPWNSKSHHIKFSHVDFEHSGNYGYNSLNPAHDVIKGDPVDESVKLRYLYFTNCYIHDANRSLLTLLDAENVLFESCYFARGGLHQECSSIAVRLSKNIVFRRNIFEDTKNVFFALRWVDNIYIYSNIFIGNIDVGHWEIYSAIHNGEGHAYNVHIYGNTFSNLKGLAGGVRLLGEHSNIFTYNNLWANCKTNNINLDGIHSHNAFYENYRVNDFPEPQKIDENIADEYKQILTSNPFTSADNFQLSYATEDGNHLSAPFNIDFNGNIRGVDGIWDRGAFEYQE